MPGARRVFGTQPLWFKDPVWTKRQAIKAPETSDIIARAGSKPAAVKPAKPAGNAKAEEAKAAAGAPSAPAGGASGGGVPVPVAQVTVAEAAAAEVEGAAAELHAIGIVDQLDQAAQQAGQGSARLGETVDRETGEIFAAGSAAAAPDGAGAATPAAAAPVSAVESATQSPVAAKPTRARRAINLDVYVR